IQNLLGEGTLSASFIPVYSRLVSEGDDDQAGRVGGTIFGLLAAAAGALSLIVWALAPFLTAVLTPGLEGSTRDLTIDLIRIMAPGTAFLVMSAWCLGILNSHDKFFLSYVAPVVWNASQIIVVLFVGARGWAPPDIAMALGWAVLIGGIAQFGVQIGPVLRNAPPLRLGWSEANSEVRSVLSRFGPAVAGRGVVQISAFIDTLLASLLMTGALSGLFAAQILYILPISLFAMSVAAAELPLMSSIDDLAVLGERVAKSLARIAFFIVFVTVAYIAAGDLIIGALFQRNLFSYDDTLGVWLILAAYSIGLPATANSRMLQNVSFSLGDTAGPARIAMKRVFIALVLGIMLMIPLDQVAVFGGELTVPSEADAIAKPSGTAFSGASYAMFLGAAGLALGSAIASWYELFALRSLLRKRMKGLISPFVSLRALVVPAATAFVVATGLKILTTSLPAFIAASVVIGISGFVYVLVAFRSGVTEARLVLGPLRKLIWRR
ncbi:MAG: murein biosynthesis integral membrane protein MurJ, partial [Acidobacteria bacterium]|nr:murein biosynthesis integral membrane protein MurJ [Acidobacteriota bacterium]